MIYTYNPPTQFSYMYTDLCFMNVSDQWRMKQIESGRLARPKFPEILTSQKKGMGSTGMCRVMSNFAKQ